MMTPVATTELVPTSLNAFTQGRCANDAKTIAFGEVFYGYNWVGHEMLCVFLSGKSCREKNGFKSFLSRLLRLLQAWIQIPGIKK